MDDPQEKLLVLKRQMEALDGVGDVLNPVLSYWKKLCSLPRDQQTNQQRLWLLAYGAVNSKMSPGTPSSMVEAANLLPILYDTISIIYLLGVDHFTTQLPHENNDSGKVVQFLERVKKICTEKNIKIIAEEISEDGLSSHQIDCTHIGRIVSQLGVEYFFCDPGQAEREKLGVKQREDIALELLIHPPYTPAQEDQINKVAAKSDREREKYWLDQIKLRSGENKAVLLVCGFKHTDYFIEMAGQEGCIVEKLN